MNFVRVEQLDILGFTVEYRTLAILCGCFVCLYFVLYKLLHYVLRKQLFFFLTYIISSVLLLFIGLVLTREQPDLQLLKQMFLAISVFGLTLFCYLLFLAVKKSLFTKKKSLF